MPHHAHDFFIDRACTLIYTHADFYVVAKPAGWGMHQEGAEASIVTKLSEHFQAPLWPVHRLDTATSGLLILARNKHAAAHFGTLFEQHQVQKYYLAISDRKPKKKQGLIRGDMTKSRNGTWKLTNRQDNPAVTQFFSTSMLTDPAPDATPYRLFLLKPKTGRTHQLRVALKSLGSAILGDNKYRGTAAPCMHLHAYGLCFTYQETPLQLFTAPTHTELWQQATAQLNDLNWQAPQRLHWPKVADSC